MTSEVKAFDNFTKPRVSQLSQRSNQFNLRTIRYTEQEIENLMKNDDYLTISFTLVDKFGDNGLICMIILKKEDEETLFIENWLMSCRVLKRGMEDFTLNAIVETAKKHNFKKIIGEYIETPKNSMVKNHYENLGFLKKENFWELNINNFQPKEVFIKIK